MYEEETIGRLPPQNRPKLKHRSVGIVAPSPLETPVLPRLSFNDEEFALNREAFERFSIIFGPFTWDLFASSNNAQCPAFFTRETHALAQEWASLGNLWPHPPCVASCCGRRYSLPLAKATDGAREKVEVDGAEVQRQEVVVFMIP